MRTPLATTPKSDSAKNKPVQSFAHRRYNGEGGLRFRDDKKLWQFEIDLPRGVDGKRRKRTVYGKTPQEVKRKVADLAAQGGGTLQPVNPTTLTEYVDAWFTRKAKDVRPKTVDSYQWAWGHAKPIIGHVKLEKFDRATVVRFFDALGEAGASAYTIGKVSVVMHSIFEDAIARGSYTNGLNPFYLARKAKPKHKVESGRALTIDECKRFKAAARHDPLEAAWIIGLTTGMRISEIFGLQWDDIDFDAKTIHVRRQAQPVAGKLVIGPLKTNDTSREDTPIGPDALAALLRRRDAATMAKHHSVWVFPSENPEMPMNPNNVRRRSFADIAKAANIAVSPRGTRPGPFTPHDLRHTMNSIGAACGISEQVLSERSGHANSTITRRYTHTYASQGRQAAEKIEEMMR